MIANRRRAGRKIRRQIAEIVRLDTAWRRDGKAEGRTENDLCWKLGIAYRAGLRVKVDRARDRNARRMGL